MKKLSTIALSAILLFSPLSAKDQKTKIIQTIGDILQFMPIVPASYALAIKDYKGLQEYAIGFGSTMGVVLATKLTLDAISKQYPHNVKFAQRPDGSNFQGFPSGHTASAATAAGFMQKRYGWEWGLPLSILAGFTGFSRVYAKRHSTFQVVAGGMLGFTISYLSASKYIDPRKEKISFYQEEGSKRGEQNFVLSYSRKF